MMGKSEQKQNYNKNLIFIAIFGGMKNPP